MLKGIHQQLEPQDSPAFFVRGPKSFPRLMFFCSVSLLMMAADARFDYLRQLRQGFSAVMHPLEVLASAPNEWGRHINTYFTSHHRLIQENFKLRQQAVFDHAALQRLATVEAENTHLRSLLSGDTPMLPEATLGEVLHMGRDPFSNIITINRGSQHNVLPGQAVVDAEGVVGQITRVYPFTSEVTLITDKKLSIPIQIERNQLRAIAFGEGKRNTLDIPYLPTSVDIKVGDKLVTSGIDGVYPAGLAVATVIEIKQSQDSPFAKIISKPVAGVNNHKHVLIIKLSNMAVTSDSTHALTQPRVNAQHLDQSVVEVLQQHNASINPENNPNTQTEHAEAGATPTDQSTPPLSTAPTSDQPTVADPPTVTHADTPQNKPSVTSDVTIKPLSADIKAPVAAHKTEAKQSQAMEKKKPAPAIKHQPKPANPGKQKTP